MQNCKTLRQPLLGELAMSRKKKEERGEKNALYSGHLCLCQQPRAAHALRSDQNLQNDSNKQAIIKNSLVEILYFCYHQHQNFQILDN